MTAEAAIWTPELWTPGIGWRPKPLPKFNLRTWRKAKEDTVVEAVAQAQGVFAAGSSNLATLTITQPGATSLLVAYLAYNSNTTTAAAPTQGGTWTVHQSNASTLTMTCKVWSLKNPSTVTTVSSSLSVAQAWHFYVIELTGTTTAAPAVTDNQAINNDSFNNSTDNSAAATPTNSPDITIGHAEAQGTTAFITDGAPWNLVSANITGGVMTSIMEWCENTGSVISYTGKKNGNSLQSMKGIVNIKETAAPGARRGRILGFASTAGRSSNR